MLVICNTYCFATATVVLQMCISVTLYVHCCLVLSMKYALRSKKQMNTADMLNYTDSVCHPVYIWPLGLALWIA
jgi:hypothetical protein